MARLNLGNISKKTVKLFDFSGGINSNVDATLYQNKIFDYAVNFDYSKKSLKDGHGLGRLCLGESIYPELSSNIVPIKGYSFRFYDKINEKYDDRILIYCSDKYVYECHVYSTEPSFIKVEGLNFDTVPQAVCYKYNGDDVMIFGSGKGLKIYDGTTVKKVDDAPQITSMCMHSERLFITCGGEGTTLFFSDDFDPANWSVSLTEAGFIDFQDGLGSLIKVVSFNDYVYVFRSYGITKIYAYGDQSEFYSTNILSGCPKIKENCVFLCGDKIIYLTESGFYSFNGSYSTKIMNKLDEYLDVSGDENFFGAYHNEKLFVYLKLSIDGGIKYHVIVYNTESGWFYLMDGIRLSDITAINGENFNKLIFLPKKGNLVYELTNTASIDEEPKTKLIKTAFGDFDINKTKTLAYIYLCTDSSLQIVVKTDYEEKTFYAHPRKIKQKIPIGMRCNSLSLELISDTSDAHISKVECEFLIG